jgi:Icc-related predicted phosphoesterase
VLENAGADVLVLAGDIVLGEKIEKHKKFFDDVSKKFSRVIYIPGNHEYYGGDFNKTNIKITEFITMNYPNITYSCFGEDRDFLYGTMWSNFNDHNPISMASAQYRMNDFKLIKNGTRKFTPQDAYSEFSEFESYIKAYVYGVGNDQEEWGGCLLAPPIIITHHAPSFKSVHREYRASDINGAYASNLEQLMIDGKVKLWVHGHVHNSNNYMVGSTRVVSNPRGYFPDELNLDFNPNLIVEI